jgi:hypothetical protein
VHLVERRQGGEREAVHLDGILQRSVILLHSSFQVIFEGEGDAARPVGERLAVAGLPSSSARRLLGVVVLHGSLGSRPVTKSQTTDVLCGAEGRSHRLLDRLVGAGAAATPRVAIRAVQEQQRGF